MKARLPREGGVGRRAARLATTSLALAVIAASSGCLDRPVAPLLPLTTSTETDLLKQTSVDKIDMLLMIDNSSSMADKQAVLAAAVPDLVTGILNPKCVDQNGQAVPNQPAGPTLDCPQGSQREFPPVLDIHVGIITSSLGTFGAFACSDPSVAVCTDLDDHAHLVTRTTPCDPSKGDVPTYQSEGFLAWDPKGTDNPAGIADIGTFTTDLTDLVTGTGQDGCGFEQQNEAWYRFLVDPAPASSFTFNGDVQKVGTDTDLLTQRSEFLRPDSLLAIVVLTDETDVSIKEQSYFPTLAETAVHIGDMISINQLPNARSECATNGPADPCCSSCGLPTPAGCPDESGPGQPCDNTPPASFINTADNPAIRAFGLTNGKQSLKARYGIEFLYPTSRYVAALTQTTLADDQGKSFPNPLLAQRDPSLLFYATITGVPWQLIAHSTNGKADLAAGFMTPKELAGNDPTGQSTYWDDIVGDPDNYVSPKSPFMQESDAPRSGTDPITGITLSTTGMNGLNGHDRAIPNTIPGSGDSRGDIEYACTFPLPAPMQKNCATGSSTAGCDCGDDGTGSNATNPLCAPNPNDNGKPTLQVAAKAYPGIRNLAIVKGMYDSGADTGIVASICPQQFDTPDTQDANGNTVPVPNYGYRPAVKAIIDRLKQAIHNQCLARNLPTTNGSAPCIVLEQQPSGDCSCSGTARAVVADQYKQAVTEAQQLAQQLDPGAPAGCYCEITQTTGAALTSCQNEVSTSGIDGWCYVDATTVPALGNPTLVAECPENEQRQVRFVGKGTPVPNALTFVTCEGQ